MMMLHFGSVFYRKRTRVALQQAGSDPELKRKERDGMFMKLTPMFVGLRGGGGQEGVLHKKKKPLHSDILVRFDCYDNFLNQN